MIWILLLTLLAGWACSVGLGLWRNVRAVRATGLPYRTLPVSLYNVPLMLVWRQVAAPALNLLWPGVALGSWRQLLSPGWAWQHGYAAFVAVGGDSFFTASPGGIVFQTADAAVIAQVVARAHDFPKITRIYRSVNIYGTNVVSTEGAAWRRHRKVLGPAFSEATNLRAWQEALAQGQSMVAAWVDAEGRGVTVRTVAEDAMRLSLHVICGAGFGQKLAWPKRGSLSVDETPAGHKMSLAYSLHFLLEHLLYIMAVPRWILRLYPSKMFNDCYVAYDEWYKYMGEMIAAKNHELRSMQDTTHVDVIGQIIKGQQHGVKGTQALTDQEVMGNMFVLLLAGHETTANSIHFCLLYLALHPAAQRAVQRELAEILGDRPATAWSYEHDLPRLLNGMTGAVLNEQLRLISPIINVPKETLRPQTLTVDGRAVTIPAGTVVRLSVLPVHKNPKFWPHAKVDKETEVDSELLKNDLDEFKPERWLRPPGDDPAGDAGFLFTPPKGAFLAFSEGSRACLGKRFAQVEIVAVLATILTRYSVELAVDDVVDGGGEARVADLTAAQKSDAWHRAAAQARWKLRHKLSSVVTLQMRGTHVPIRLARRGEEVFSASE